MMRCDLRCVLGLAVLGCLLGCNKGTGGRGDTVTASGVVTLNGSPVAEAQVTFAPKGGAGSAAFASTDSTGRFTLSTSGTGDGAVPGEYNVAIIKQITEGPQLTDQDVAEYQAKHGTMPPAPTVKFIIPEQYGDAAKSGLTATITKEGPNELKFDLK